MKCNKFDFFIRILYHRQFNRVVQYMSYFDFPCKNREKKLKIYIEIYRENDAILIKRLKFFIALKIRGDYERDCDPLTHIYPWKCVLIPGTASASCLELGIGQWRRW